MGIVTILPCGASYRAVKGGSNFVYASGILDLFIPMVKTLIPLTSTMDFFVG